MYTHCAVKKSIYLKAFINLYDKIVGFIKKSLYLMPVKVPSITLSIKLHFYHRNQLFYTFSVHTSFQSTLNLTKIFKKSLTIK